MILMVKIGIDIWTQLNGDIDMIIDDNLFGINDEISYIVNLDIWNCFCMI